MCCCVFSLFDVNLAVSIPVHQKQLHSASRGQPHRLPGITPFMFLRIVSLILKLNVNWRLYSVHIIRPPDIVCRKALINAVGLFYRACNLLYHALAARQMCITGSAIVSTRSSCSAFSPTPPLIFTGSKNVKFGLDR